MKGTLPYCTLFNAAYLARGLAMYNSLTKVCDDFHLYVFAFDDSTYKYFQEAGLPHLTVISLKEFEDSELLRIKGSRTAGEYCWTCTPSTILYCIEKFGLDHCTYIDADMIFYHDPRVLNEEVQSNSVMITEHRYTPEYDQSATSGIYCVQYVLFKNDERGLKVLRWWRDACIDWCYNRLEEGKFGDQKYLDDWTSRFEGVHVMKHEGGGVAPWNMQQYALKSNDQVLMVKNHNSGISSSLIFVHFHGVRFYREEVVEFTGAGYSLSVSWKDLIFRPYALSLFELAVDVQKRAYYIRDANGVSDITKRGHFSNGIAIFKRNVFEYLRYVAGRSGSFRKFENHVYHRSEL